MEQWEQCLEMAFTCLEKEVKRGRIQFYGVSSNVWSRDHLNLDRLLNIAKKGKCLTNSSFINDSFSEWR